MPKRSAVGKQTTAFSSKFRRLRACARCHRLKMRCVFDDPNYQSCKRCFELGIPCSMTKDPTEKDARPRPQRRTSGRNSKLTSLQRSVTDTRRYLLGIQRKLTEHKNDEIETEKEGSPGKVTSSAAFISSIPSRETISTLQSHLSGLQTLLAHISELEDSELGDVGGNRSTRASAAASMKEGPVRSVPSLPYIAPQLNVMKELIKLGIISDVAARQRFKIFRHSLLAYWPCVSLSAKATYEYLKENEPLELLGFVTVTCLNEPDLHDTLLYYLERSLARKTSITGDITVQLIEIYLTLSLWCSPPRKWGSYKHQMSLMMALDISLCLDLGNDQYTLTADVLHDDSRERRILRAYMGVYACCGSLGLSLPRFKVVTWTPHHAKCARLLLMGDSSKDDHFLCWYSRLVAIGEEIFGFLYPLNGRNFDIQTSHYKQTDSPKKEDSDSSSEGDSDGRSQKHLDKDSISSLKTMMIGYERRMQQLAVESGLFTEHSKQRNMLSIIYYQLLMTMYDYVVCKVLLLRKRAVMPVVYMETLRRLVKASEKVIESFVNLCHQTINFPTFFYYRPMHALVALIRARLLVKTQQLELDINVEEKFESVSRALKKISQNSKVAAKMSIIMTRISKWMKVSNKFNEDGATNSMVDLLNELGREKAVENIRVTTVKRKDGDDNTLRGDSRVNFSHFINYSPDSLARAGRMQRKRHERIRERADLQKSNSAIPFSGFRNFNPEMQRRPMSTPNVIGSGAPYRSTNTVSSAVMVSRINSQSSVSSSDSPMPFIPSPIGFNTGDYPEPHKQKKEQQKEGEHDITDISAGINMTDISAMKGTSPLPDNGMGVNTGISTSISNIDGMTENGLTDSPKQQKQQQQVFLNDLFSQIDTDILSFQISNEPMMFEMPQGGVSAGTNGGSNGQLGKKRSFSAADYGIP